MNVQTIKIDLYEPKIPQIEIGTQGTLGVEAVDFELNSSEWDGLTLLVSFLPGGTITGVSVFYTGEPILVPSEVMSMGGWHKMIISGTTGGKIINSKLVKLFVSPNTMTPCITPDPEPTPTTYQQVVDMMVKQAHDAVDAEAAQVAAETAQGQSEAARDAAQGHAGAAQTAQDGAEDARDISVTASAESKAWATGEGADAGDEQYENNAKYYAEDAEQSAEEALNNKLNGIETHNDDEASHPTLISTLQMVEAIARGKSNAKVFDTEAEMLAWLDVPENVETLNAGDNLYIIALDVPDYWWDGEQPQVLEAENVNFEDFYTKTQVNALLPISISRPDYEALVAAGTVQAGRNYDVYEVE